MYVVVCTIGLPRGKGGMRDRAAGETVAGTGERVHRAVGKTVLSRPVLSQLVFCFSFPGVVCRCAVLRIGWHRFPTAAQPLVCGWLKFELRLSLVVQGTARLVMRTRLGVGTDSRVRFV